jgi:penicillin G amidase
MRLVKVKYFARLSVIVGVVFILLVIGLSVIALWGGLKEDHGYKYLESIHSKVIIKKGPEGVVDINAQNRDDLLFAQGYVSAQYRLLQMMVMRQTFKGRMSEVVGQKALLLDEYMRVFGFSKSAEASYQHFSPQTKRYLEAYARGVNQYLHDHDLGWEFKVLHFKPEEWRPVDSVIIAKAMAWNLGRNWTQKYSNSYIRQYDGISIFEQLYPNNDAFKFSTVSAQELLEFKLPTSELSAKVRFPDSPQITKEDLELFKPFVAKDVTLIEKLFSGETRQPGSNAWAISAKYSKNKHPLLANDPHLEMNVPGSFYMVRLESPEGVVSGGALPGAPFVVVGHNDHVAWGLTNSHADQSDLQICRSCSKASVRKEIINIKGGAQKTILVKDVKYGRVVGQKGSKQARFLWMGLSDEDTTLEGLFELNEAVSVKSALKALKKWVAPGQNLVIIDSKHIAYRLIGSVPNRQYSGRFVTSNYWNGYIPQHQMPFLLDPKKGFVANSNNVIANSKYKYNLNRLEYDNVRQYRLQGQLNQRVFPMSLEDQRNLQLDVKDQEWVLLKKDLMKLDPKSFLDKKAYEVLKKWDGYAGLNSVGVTIYSQWIREIAKEMYADFRGRPTYHQPRYNVDSVKLKLRKSGKIGTFESSQELLEYTFHNAVFHLAKNLGTNVDHWKWKYVHKAFFKHGVFGRVPYLGYWFNRSIAAPGSRETLNRSRWFAKTKWFDAVEGPVIRLLVDGASFKHDQTMIAPGQSGSLFSSHYDDLLALWSKGGAVDVAGGVSGSVDALGFLPEGS